MYAASDHEMLQFPPRPLVMERRWNMKSSAEVAPNCPRCASPNTKFCYYNNYSLSQPRYFCKACRRYWTKGGSLRNVPVGGGCRKSRRSKAACPPPPTTINSYGISPTPGPPVGDLSQTGGPDGSGSIDLAEVFAKFLNPNSINGSSDLPGSPHQETQEPDPFLAGLASGVDPNQREEGIDHGFSGHDPIFFGLETMINDELDQDLLWGEDTTTLPNFGWQQPTVEMQDLGSFSSDDDQSKISENVVSDNWSLFDLSAYEIFSGP